MPENSEDLQNPPKLPSKFEPGKFLGVKDYKDEEGLLHLFDTFFKVTAVHFRESEKLLVPLVKLIDKGVDFRSIFFLMITCDNAELAKDWLKYLESNKIFFPIDKPFRSPRQCPNFFAEVASLGSASVTKALFKYGVNGLKHSLKAKKDELTEAEIKEKINEFVEELFALTFSTGKYSTLEYVIATLSPTTLFYEGFGHSEDMQDKLFEIGCSFTGILPEDLEFEYNLPWETIKVLTELGLQYNIDLRDSESSYLSYGDKIFDILAKATDDKETMAKLVKDLILPYSGIKVIKQDELETYGDNNEDYFFNIEMDGMHYAATSNVLLTMDTEFIKSRYKSVMMLAKPESFNKATIEVIKSEVENLKKGTEELEKEAIIAAADRRRHSVRLRSHSGDIHDQAVTLEKHNQAIEVIKLDVQDLQKGAAELKKIVETNLADNLIFENLGNDKFLTNLYISTRDSIFKKLNAALDGNKDKQMELMLKNGKILAGSLDFAAGFAGVPGVIGASFGVIAYACKYFEKLHEQRVSSEMKAMLVGSLDLPKLIAVGVAEALALKAKDNLHGKTYKKDQEKHIIAYIDDLVSRQLSGNHLDKLLELMLDSASNQNAQQHDIFQELKRILIETIINGHPHTSDLLRRDSINKDSKANGVVGRMMRMTGFSSDSRKHSINQRPHGTHEMVQALFNPASPKHSEEARNSTGDASKISSGVLSDGSDSPLSTSTQSTNSSSNSNKFRLH